MLLPVVTAANVEIVGAEEKFITNNRYIHLTLKNSGTETVNGIETYLNSVLVFSIDLKPGDSVTEIFPSSTALAESEIKVVAAGTEIFYQKQQGQQEGKGVSMPEIPTNILLVALIVVIILAIVGMIFLLKPKKAIS